MTEETPQAQIIKFTCDKMVVGKLLVDILAEKSNLSKSLIKKLMMYGAVHQTYKKKRKRIRKAKTKLNLGDVVECYFDPKIPLDHDYEFTPLYETKHYGIYLKPAGILSQGTDYGDKSSIFRHVEKLRKKAYLVNRLDKETEGLVIVAYDSRTQNFFQEMWKKGVTKKYQAIVLGELEEKGTFDFKINTKESTTHYECIKTIDNKSYVDISIETGRKHQIRIHFSKAGFPVIGDPKYGKGNKNRDGLQLISYLLEFTDPYTNKMVKVSLPKDRHLF
ncbi:MAG: RluA family pseudouridine synthase [Bacteriovoracaceae bacterium]|jgi:tRNA pseudouridine32 synthase / 23S rRNA pseudouridine746 synthase|nr:RluA family pseudouridine synthase [Bacteriovoracaceae bacterium]